MDYEIIGVEEKKGEYNGVPYHNYFFHCSRKSSSENVVGQIVVSVKLSYIRAKEILHDVDNQVFNLLGKRLAVFYNEKGYIEDFSLQL